MTDFKPGMHQIVETKKVDFNAIVAKMVGVQPQPAYPMIGWGKKVFIQATLKKPAGDKVVIEFYTELTFPECPADRTIGYTHDDSKIFQGVSILDYDAESDKDGYHPSFGEVMTYEEFAEQHITEPRTRAALARVMDDMLEQVEINDQTIDRINTAWENRNPGDNVLYDVKYQ